MKIIIVGLGSMGKRRARLVKQIYSDSEIFGVDGVLERRREFSEIFSTQCFAELQYAISEVNPDIAFVCASPLAHFEITKTCLQNGIDVFSEINLINENHEELIALADANRCCLFLSSTPLYRKEIQFITAEVAAQKKPVSYIYHVGQYLPDWHPWETYKDFFVGDKRTNGCREIFVIELPWMVNCFGEIESFVVKKASISNLHIDYPDTYRVLIEHSNGNQGVLCVDVVSREAVRKLEIYGEDIYLAWEGTPENLAIRGQDDRLEKISVYSEVQRQVGYSTSIIENMYEEEIRDFLNCIKGKTKGKHSFVVDVDILKLVNQIEGVTC